MLDAEKWAKNKEFNAAYLNSYTRTEPFYKKCGYEKVNLVIIQECSKGNMNKVQTLTYKFFFIMYV